MAGISLGGILVIIGIIVAIGELQLFGHLALLPKQVVRTLSV